MIIKVFTLRDTSNALRFRSETSTRYQGAPVKASDPVPRDLQDLPPTVPLQVASRILGIGRDQGYELARADTYPVRVLKSNGRYKVSKFDLLAYLGAI
jgi:hypothetical protein